MKHLFLSLLFCCGAGLILMANPTQLMDDDTESGRGTVMQAITDSPSGTQNVHFFTKVELLERKIDIRVIKRTQSRLNQPKKRKLINYSRLLDTMRPKPPRPPGKPCGLGPIKVVTRFEDGSNRNELFILPTSPFGRLSDR